MNRSAQLARLNGTATARLVFLLLSLVAALVAIGGSANPAAAVTEVPGYSLYTTADLCKLTVSPKAATAEVGATQTFTATLTAVGPTPISADAVLPSYGDTYDACAYKELDALEGAIVTFKVTSGPNAGKTADVPLTAAATASYSFSSAAAGVDVVEADLTLPDVCYAVYHGNIQSGAVPDACAGRFEEELPVPTALPSCQQLQVEAVQQPDCLTVTLTDTGQVTWTAPAVVVAESADPSLSIAGFKRCVSSTFKISPSYSGGDITSSTLFVDGKKKQTHNGSAPFNLSARSYKAGKHNFEVVTVFSTGKAASKFGSFSRCAARVTVKHVSPKFTG